MDDFDSEAAMALGGWDPRYARVLDVRVDGDFAGALVDSNGDGADVNVDVYRRGGDGQWVSIASGNGSVEVPGLRAVWTDDDRLVLTRTGEGLR